MTGTAGPRVRVTELTVGRVARPVRAPMAGPRTGSPQAARPSPGCALFPRLRPLPRVTHTRTPIYETPAAHKGLIPPLCAMPCFLIPSLVCGTEKDGR